jgi:membrane protein DedA with SNARE-associated domain
LRSSCPGSRRSRPALAGALGLRYWKFVLFDLIGSLLWVGVAVAIGYVFRDAIGDALETLQSLGKWGLVLVVAAFRSVDRDEVVAAHPVHQAAADGSRDGR